MNTLKLSKHLTGLTLLAASIAIPAQPVAPADAAKRSGTAPSSSVKPRTATLTPNTQLRTPLTASEQASVESSTTINRIRTQQRIVIAFSKTASPFSVAQADGSAAGFAIDLCTKVALAIQKQLKLSELRIEFVSPPFTERLQAVKEGKADMECANTISNAERKQTLGFSLPFFLTVSKALVKNESPIVNLSTLRGRNVVSTENSSSERIFKTINQKFLVGANLISRPTAAAAFASLSKGEAEAFFMTDIVLYDLLAKAPDSAQYRVLRDAYSVDGIAVVLAKEDSGMKLVVDRELKRIMSDEEIGKLYTKWFASPIPPSNINLNLKMNQLTRDHYKRPSDEVNLNSLF